MNDPSKQWPCLLGVTARLDQRGCNPKRIKPNEKVTATDRTGGTLSFHQALVPKSALADYPQQVTWHEIGSRRSERFQKIVASAKYLFVS